MSAKTDLARLQAIKRGEIEPTAEELKLINQLNSYTVETDLEEQTAIEEHDAYR